jgi:uncharacterized protein YcfJ
MNAKRWRNLLIAAVMGTTPGLAGAEQFTETWAPVVEAQPVWQSVRIPQEHDVCWDETVHRITPARRSAAPKILGAIVGGVIGHQFGGGSGQDIMTATGAALGATVVADQQYRKNPDRYYTTLERRCETRIEYRLEERIIAWDVTYEFNGDQYRARMNEAPGDRIRIRVGVTPLSGG